MKIIKKTLPKNLKKKISEMYYASVMQYSSCFEKKHR